jgi:hypothetical protein
LVVEPNRGCAMVGATATGLRRSWLKADHKTHAKKRYNPSSSPNFIRVRAASDIYLCAGVRACGVITMRRM